MKTSDKPFRICLVVGDWSGDGHDKTTEVTIASNFNEKAIDCAYKRGTKALGFDFSEEVAADYEDTTLSAKHAKAFADKGFSFARWCKNDEGYVLDATSFVTLWLFVVALGDPSVASVVVTDETPTLNVGGYGLFT